MRLVLNCINFDNKINLDKLDNNHTIIPTINWWIIILICLLLQPDAGTALLLDFCCFAYSWTNTLLLYCSWLTLAALLAANPGSTITVLPAAPLPTSTAIPAVITVYKVKHYSLKYNLDASTILLLNRQKLVPIRI